MDIRVTWNAGNLPPQVKAAAIQGLNEGAERLLGRSNERVPVDTAFLRSSGSVHPAFDGDLAAWVIYSAHYAVIVHENTSARFSQVRNPGARAKFLESAARDHREEIIRLVEARVRRVLQS